MKKTENEDEEVMILYEWVDSMPLSRLKKSINRDFSDGVLMAEVLKYLYPKLVNLNYYPEVHSIMKKKYNWTALNEKVFKKLELPLSKKTIEQLANSEQGVIEQVLKKVYLKVKNDECTLQQIDLMNSKKLKEEKEKNTDYKTIIFNKEMEITKLKERLKILQKEINLRQQENNNIKEEINDCQKKLEIEKNTNNII